MKTKTIFLSLFLMLASIDAWAQEKYEYATVIVNSIGLKGGQLLVSKNGSYEEISIKTTKQPLTFELSPVMEYLETMNKDGWETLSMGYMQSYPVYFLRRKKN